MIKRCSSLSITAGGTVEVVEAEPGKMRKINTYCRFYQMYPVRRSILCYGFLDYPPCPDLQRCLQNKPVKRRDPEIEQLVGVDEEGSEGG